MEDISPQNSPVISLVEEIVEAVSPIRVTFPTESESTEEENTDQNTPTTVDRPCDRLKRKSNERERWRHSNVNDAFKTLGSVLPIYPLTKKLKKKDILKRSIKYINVLTTLLRNLEDRDTVARHKKQRQTYDPDMDTLTPNDTHAITLITDDYSSAPANSCSFTQHRRHRAISGSSCSSHPEEDATSSSDYHSHASVSPMTQPGAAPSSPPHDGADDWLADMLDDGYFY